MQRWRIPDLPSLLHIFWMMGRQVLVTIEISQTSQVFVIQSSDMSNSYLNCHLWVAKPSEASKKQILVCSEKSGDGSAGGNSITATALRYCVPAEAEIDLPNLSEIGQSQTLLNLCPSCPLELFFCPVVLGFSFCLLMCTFFSHMLHIFSSPLSSLCIFGFVSFLWLSHPFSSHFHLSFFLLSPSPFAVVSVGGKRISSIKREKAMH